MIDYTTVARKVETFLSENFTDCKIQFENVAVKEKHNGSYISITDTIVESELISVGVVKCDALMLISIHTKLGIGTDESRSIAKSLDTLLANQELDGIQFTESELKSVPITRESTNFIQVLQIPYVFAYNGDV